MLTNSFEIKQSLKTNRAILLTGAISAVMQLLVLMGMAAVMAALGPRLNGAEEYFAAYTASPTEMFLRSEVFIIVLIAL